MTKKKELSPKEKLYKKIYDKVYNYKTKSEYGFIDSEIEDILKDFPGINMKKFNDAMMGNTCMMSDDNKIINYHHDVEKAIRCGVENRDLTWLEWD